MFFQLFLTASLAAAPLQLEGVRVPPSVTVEKKRLVLNGAGFRSVVNWKMYVLALYVDKPSHVDDEILSIDRTKRVVLTTLRDIDKNTITKALARAVERNTQGSTQDWTARLKPFFEALRDAPAGDVVVLTGIPKRGTVVTAGGKTFEVHGDDATRVMFSIWLGEFPVDQDLKESILGVAPASTSP